MRDRAMPAASRTLASPSSLLRLLERGDGILGEFVKLAKFEGGAAADIVALMREAFDQRRNDLCRVALSPRQGARRFNPLDLCARLQIRDQLVGRFPRAAAAARQQAKQQNQTCLHVHHSGPRSE